MPKKHRERALTQTKHHLKQTGTGSQQNNPNIRVTQQRATPQAQITPSEANWSRGTAEKPDHQCCIMMWERKPKPKLVQWHSRKIPTSKLQTTGKHKQHILPLVGKLAQGHSRKIPTSQLHHDKREKLFITDYHIRKHKTSQQNIW